jgi:hypothetical protein
MNQNYAEAGVKRKDTTGSIALRLLLILGIVNGVLITLLGGIISVLGIAMILFIIYFFPRLNVEYEYIFVDGQMDFDRISGKTKRKTLLRIDFDQVEIVAPKNSHALDAYANIQSEKKDFSSRDKNREPYVIILSREGKKLEILFEPNEKMIATMKQKLK